MKVKVGKQMFAQLVVVIGQGVSRSFLPAASKLPARIERIAQAIADVVEGEREHSMMGMPGTSGSHANCPRPTSSNAPHPHKNAM